ncbi:MAG: aminoglycoside phosphotransferase family protein [Pyrinomonadaceae bacterium]
MNFAAAQQLLLAPDADVPQRDALLDARLMEQRLSVELRKRGMTATDGCEIARVKYSFGKNIRVLYHLRFGEKSLGVAARTFGSKRIAEIGRQRKTDSNSAPNLLDQGLRTAFWIFPNDRKICGLEVLTTIPGELKTSAPGWGTSRVVAYAPEKCATAECIDNGGEVIAYAKVFAGDSGRRIAGIYEHLRDSNLKVPRVLGYSESHRTLVLEAIRGARLADLVESSATVYQKLGTSIARFHSVPPHGHLPRFKRLEPNEIQRALNTILIARPDVAAQSMRFFDELTSFPFSTGPEVCLHGDVHPKNAVWKDGTLTLIDLDQVSIGDAAADIGSFLAGLHYKERVGQMSAEIRSGISKSFLEGYAEIRPLPSERSLRWHTAAALFAERSLRAITRVRVEGLENIGRILAAGEKVLRGEDR